MLAWRYGGPWEKLFVLLINLGFAHVIVLAYLIARTSQYDETSITTLWSVLTSAIFFPPIQAAFVVPLSSPSVIRQGLHLGFATDSRKEYDELLAKYKETFGVEGHLPGDRAIGLAFWAVFNAKLYAAMLLTAYLLPSFGDWSLVLYTTIDVPVSIGLRFSYYLRSRRLFSEAAMRGFPLMRLRAKE
jgi:hypothetical protein